MAAAAERRTQKFHLTATGTAALWRVELGTRQILKSVATAILLACVCTSALAQRQQQQPTPRSRDTHGNEERVAHFRCLSQTTAAYATYEGPQAAREAGQAAYLMSCVLNTMPPDWVSASDYRAQAQKFAEAARQSDPTMDACLLTACATEPAK